MLKGDFERAAQTRKMLVNIAAISQHRTGKAASSSTIHGGGKRERIRAGVTGALAQHRIKFKRGSPGAALLVEQLRGFPTCKYDDGPDALEMVLSLAARAVTSGVAFGSERLQAALQQAQRVRA